MCIRDSACKHHQRFGLLRLRRGEQHHADQHADGGGRDHDIADGNIRQRGVSECGQHALSVLSIRHHDAVWHDCWRFRACPADLRRELFDLANVRGVDAHRANRLSAHAVFVDFFDDDERVVVTQLNEFFKRIDIGIADDLMDKALSPRGHVQRDLESHR